MATIGGSNGIALQKRATRRDGWTKDRRVAFLDMLEATCNIRRAAAAAGMTDGTARSLRRRDPVFARAWEEALDLGCERIRAELIARALRSPTGDDENPTLDEREALGSDPLLAEPPMDDAMRIKVLQICRAVRTDRDERGRWRRARPALRTPEEAVASILAKLDRLERHRRR